jgi:hypothetical protein
MGWFDVEEFPHSREFSTSFECLSEKKQAEILLSLREKEEKHNGEGWIWYEVQIPACECPGITFSEMTYWIQCHPKRSLLQVQNLCVRFNFSIYQSISDERIGEMVDMATIKQIPFPPREERSAMERRILRP